jgi:Protein of unknown function (DUF 659)/hAT family C-terminal dimerisation region
VCTDSASNCVLAGKLIEERFPHITWAPCGAHCMDLLLEDIGRLPWAASIITEAKQVVSFIRNHHKSLALFRQRSPKELLRPGETRFATNFILLARLKEVEEPLRETIACREWTQWVNSQGNAMKSEAAQIQELVFSASFWKKVNDACDVSDPIVRVMRMLDGSKPVTGKIYKAMDGVVKEVKALGLPRAKIDVIVRLVNERWEMLHTCLHAAGYVLDPQFRGDQQHGSEEVMKGFHTFLERILPNVQDQVDAVNQLERFRNGEGLFGYQVALASASKMHAHAWWSQYGSATPQLQEVAIKCLSQVSSASSCERNWSLYDFVHSKKRNRLDPGRAASLVYVHSNLRLLSKVKDNGSETDFYKWDEPDSVPPRELEVQEIV